MRYVKPQARLAYFMSVLMVLVMSMTSVRAAMVPTDMLIQSEQLNYSRAELIDAVNSDELQAKLLELGVEPAQLSDRIASLTPAEIAQLNDTLEQQPAASGVLGVLLTIFVVFVVTDMLCATDLFSFVRCINR